MGKPEDACAAYRAVAQNGKLLFSTQRAAAAALASLVGKKAEADPSGAVARQMETALTGISTPSNKAALCVAWAEWLTEHGDFDAAKGKLADASKLIGEKNPDVVEVRAILEKAETPKVAK
jgi:hypothetical protein